MDELEFHPWTEIFPAADGKQLTRLAEQIKESGQTEPIVLYEGKILDGRSRYSACVLMGIEPKVTTFVPTTDDPLEALRWMIKKNIADRPTLTQSQLAVAGLELVTRTHKPPYRKPELRAAAEFVGAGRSSVERLVGIQKRVPGLIEKIRSGSRTIAEASRESGFQEYEHAPVPGMNDYMGKGDKFREATEPLNRYLNGWRGRGFEFRHVAPKEAASRLRTIQKLMDGLEEARADLESRALKARTRLPSK